MWGKDNISEVACECVYEGDTKPTSLIANNKTVKDLSLVTVSVLLAGWSSQATKLVYCVQQIHKLVCADWSHAARLTWNPQQSHYCQGKYVFKEFLTRERVVMVQILSPLTMRSGQCITHFTVSITLSDDTVPNELNGQPKCPSVACPSLWRPLPRPPWTQLDLPINGWVGWHWVGSKAGTVNRFQCELRSWSRSSAGSVQSKIRCWPSDKWDIQSTDWSGAKEK